MDGMKVIVASSNPVKIEAARRGFAAVFPEWTCSFEASPAPSDVPDQPSSDEETLRGARNRAANAKRARPDADFWVGLEGGIEDMPNGMMQRAWMAVLSKDGVEGLGSTGTFVIPERIAAMIRDGKELGHACDAVLGTEKLGQGMGAVGAITGGLIDRATYYEHAMILALSPFKHISLYIV